VPTRCWPWPRWGWLRRGSCWCTRGGFHPNRATSAEGVTALMAAAEAKQFAVVRWLVHEGKADPSQATHGYQGRYEHTVPFAAGSTPLMFAAAGGDASVVALLLSLLPGEAAVNRGTTGAGVTALFMVFLEGRTHGVELFLAARANVNQGRTDNGATACSWRLVRVMSPWWSCFSQHKQTSTK
jgi:ankyrin repeat protein